MEIDEAAAALQDGSGEVVQDNGVLRGRGKHLSDSVRNAILQALLSRSRNQKLEHGAIVLVSQQFGVTTVTVSNIWKRGIASFVEGGEMVVAARRKGKCGKTSI